MKRISLFFVALTLGVLSASADLPTSFPRKFLIDHFTGEACGYCPYGMYSIQDFMEAHPGQYIWLSHHYGYGTDEYTIPCNSVIGQKMNVPGAPRMSINRASRRMPNDSGSGYTTGYSFHPGYLSKTGAITINDATTANASIAIEHTYDAATRQLKVYVHGQSVDATTAYRVSVFIKESGMVGAQSDYYYCASGTKWSAFTHTNTARDVLTANLGDQVTVADNAYALDTITYSVPAAWVDTNCMIVACLSSAATNDYTIVNAEETPLVTGSMGGADKMAGPAESAIGGTYPEPNAAPITTYTFTNCFTTDYTASNNILLVKLATTKWFRYSGSQCYQNIRLWFIQSTPTLQPGVYNIDNSGMPGTVYSGYVDRTGEASGSSYQYVSKSDSTNVIATWLLVSGTVTVYDNGAIRVEATNRRGDAIDVTYGTIPSALETMEADEQQQKFFRNGQLYIRKNNRLYTPAGLLIE